MPADSFASAHPSKLDGNWFATEPIRELNGKRKFAREISNFLAGFGDDFLVSRTSG
jgi:hypothetical protein